MPMPHRAEYRPQFRPLLTSAALLWMIATMIVTMAVTVPVTPAGAEEVRLSFPSIMRLTKFKSPSGLKTNGIIFKPRLKQGVGASDNPGLDAVDPVADGFSYTKAALGVAADLDKHKLSVDVRHERRDFFREPSESFDKTQASAFARAEIDRSLSLTGRVKHKLSDEPTSRFEDLSGRRRDREYETEASLQMYKKFGNFRLQTRGNFYQSQYQKVEINTSKRHDERSYRDYGLQLRGIYKFNSSYRAFVEAALEKADYHRARDDDGFRRGSAGGGLFAGVLARIRSDLKIRAAAGYLTRDQKDSSFQDLDLFVFDGWIQWKPTKTTWITLGAETTAAETTTDASSARITREAHIRLQHNINPGVGVRFEFAVGNDDYIDSSRGRREDFIDTSLEFLFSLNRYATLSLRAEHERFFSNVPGDDLDRSSVLVSVSLRR